MYSTHLAWPEQSMGGNNLVLQLHLNQDSCRARCVTREEIVQITFNGEVKATEPVPWQRIGSTLQDHCAGLVHLHHLGHDLHKPQHPLTQILLSIKGDLNDQNTTVNKSLCTYRSEDSFIRLVVNAVPQWVIHSVIFALSGTDVLQETRQMSTHWMTGDNVNFLRK